MLHSKATGGLLTSKDVHYCRRDKEEVTSELWRVKTVRFARLPGNADPTRTVRRAGVPVRRRCDASDPRSNPADTAPSGAFQDASVFPHRHAGVARAA